MLSTPGYEDKNRLLVVIHHLAVDGVSWRVLLEDLELLLTKLKNGEPVDLGTKSSSYRQWYDALEAYGQSRRLIAQTAYWGNAVKSYQPLPVDKAYNGVVKQKDKRALSIRLGAVQTRQLLQEVPRVYHTEINDLLLCALAKTVAEWSKEDKVMIGLEGHGRESIADGIDTSRTVGWFTTHYPLLLKLGDTKTDGDLIKSVKEQLRQVPDKGVGYGVLKYINKQEAFSGAEPWDIIFNYLGQLDNVVRNSTWLAAAGESVGTSTSEEYNVSEKLWINGSVKDDELVFHWTYSSRHFNEATVQHLAASYLSNLESLIAHCIETRQAGETMYTPSDFGLASDINYCELDIFLNEPYNGQARKESIESIYRLSGLQQGMLFHGLYDEDGSGYLNHFWCDLLNPDLDILEKSWNQVCRSHTILRSAFYYDAFSIPVQAVYKEVNLPIEVLDLRDMSEDDQSAAIKQFEETDRNKGFDFKVSPLMRIGLLRLDETRYRMLWSSHHILFDGWSRAIMMGEFLKIYGALVSGKPLPVLEPDRYEEYIRYIEQIDKDKQEAYWKNYLKPIEQSTLLPFIDTSGERNKGGGLYRSIMLDINTELTAAVERFAQRHRITINTVMQGVWSYLLHSYTNNNDIVYGVIVSGRPEDLSNVEQRVGLFINSLPLYSCYKAEQKIGEWLQGIQDDQVASRKYQYTPLSQVQGWTGVRGDLFDSLLIFENYPVSKVLKDQQWSLEVENLAVNEQTNYPLSLVINSADEISIEFSYNNVLLEDEQVKEIRGHFENVLIQLVADAEAPMSALKLITKAEEHQLLHEYNIPSVGYPKDKTIVTLIEEQVEKYPNNIAVVFKEEQLTYQQLNERSNQFAHLLRNKGVTGDTLVPVCLERSLEMIIAIVGILKGGSAYVPIDPEYPSDRIQYMLEDTGASLVVVSNATASLVNSVKDLTIIRVDEEDGLSDQPKVNPNVAVLPHHLAYVIYTSGSTGRPKGVLIEHRNVVRLFKNDTALYDFNERDVWSVFHSFCFDFSVWEMYGALFYGGRMVIVPKNVTKDVTRFADLILAEKVTVLNQTPSAFYVLQEVMVEKSKEVPIRYVIFGGEALNPAKLQTWQQLYANSKLINMYGITETTVHVTYQEIERQHTLSGKSVIGKPIPTLGAYIVDNNQNLVPVGVAGELMISGAGLARGYLNRPELTAERFINDPFTQEEGAKMYRTGDLGRWLSDGSIEYLGRIDEQVKIRGFRIELGEIESVLQQNASVHNAVVLAKQDKAGNNRLVAYIIPEGIFYKDAVIADMKTKLPEYMIPALWVEMENLPLTSNGKIDRKALPDPDTTQLLRNEYVAPATDLEIKLAEIWKEILSVERVGIHDNFFELGGHSLMVMRLISAVKRELKFDLPVKTFFEMLTVGELAGYINVTTQNVHANLEDYDTITL